MLKEKMAYTKTQSSEARDYKARFEFVLTTTNSQTGEENIICQRYFKIGDFNPLCTRSSRVRDVMIRCAKFINKDLKEKSAIYTELTAPKVFSTIEEMNHYFEKEENRQSMTPGEGIVIREMDKPNYVWSAKGPKESPTKFNKSEFAHELSEDDVTKFTLTFKDNGTQLQPTPGHIVAAYSWTNILPKVVRTSIDLSNKYGKAAEGESLSLNGEAWVLNKMTEGRVDLVYKIIKEICAECCNQDDSYYTKADPFGEETLIQSAFLY